MTFPVCLTAVESLHVGRREGGRWRLTLAGVPGWCWELPRGVCLALLIERTPLDEALLMQATLWLASIPQSLDDSLVLEGERLYLIRRYALEESAQERQARIEQQLAVVRWFAAQGTQPAAGDTQAGSWA